MTDADVDGAHIRTLLLTLFFRHFAPLVNAVIFISPNHRFIKLKKEQQPAMLIQMKKKIVLLKKWAGVKK